MLGLLIILIALLVVPALVAVYFFVFQVDSEPSPLLGNQTAVPTAATPSPTQAPTFRGETRSPTRAPTEAPTTTPTADLGGSLRKFLDQEYGVNVGADASPATVKAINWLVEEASFSNKSELDMTPKYFQRFAILVVYYSIFAEDNESATANFKRSDLLGTSRISTTIVLPNWGMRNQNECYWMGMTCDSEGKLNEIRLSDIGLDGELPTELGYLPDLKYLDLSNNNMKGTMPDEIYGLEGIEKIYLYHNQFTGTISANIRNSWNLTHFHVSHNHLTGSIPATLGSANRLRPIRKYDERKRHKV
jgi:hypothetical protein